TGSVGSLMPVSEEGDDSGGGQGTDAAASVTDESGQGADAKGKEDSSDDMQKLELLHEALSKATTKEDLERLKGDIVTEILRLNSQPRSAEVEKRVERRRNALRYWILLQDQKVKADDLNNKVLGAIDKIDAEAKLMTIAKELSIQPGDFEFEDTELVARAEVITKYQTARIARMEKIVSWVSGRPSSAINFSNLPPDLQDLKRQCAVHILEQHQNVTEEAKMVERALEKLLGTSLHEATSSGDEMNTGGGNDDATLFDYLRQKDKAMQAKNQQAVGVTMTVLGMAENEMKAQSKRMDQLQELLEKQLTRSKKLEDQTQSQEKELKTLRSEIARLNNIITTRETDHSKERERLMDMMADKGRKLGEEIKANTEFRGVIAGLKGEVAHLGSLLKAAEKDRAELLHSLTGTKEGEQTQPSGADGSAPAATSDGTADPKLPTTDIDKTLQLTKHINHLLKQHKEDTETIARLEKEVATLQSKLFEGRRSSMGGSKTSLSPVRRAISVTGSRQLETIADGRESKTQGPVKSGGSGAEVGTEDHGKSDNSQALQTGSGGKDELNNAQGKAKGSTAKVHPEGAQDNTSPPKKKGCIVM
ncbi:hypothetical protein HK102_008742, partial [Quaeritorhiza haematococci]